MERLSFVLISFALGFGFFYVYLLRAAVKRHLLSHNSFLMWFAVALVLLFTAVFPTPVIALTRLFGFQVPSNGVFFLAIGFLMVLNLLQSIEISKQKAMILKITQDYALFKSTLDRRDEVPPNPRRPRDDPEQTQTAGETPHGGARETQTRKTRPEDEGIPETSI